MSGRTRETVPLKYVRTLLRVATEQGYDAERVVKQLALPREVLSRRADPNQLISAAHYNAVYTYVMAMLQDESLGVSMAEPHPAGSFRMMCLYLIHCKNLEHALLRANEFQSFCRNLAGKPAIEHEPVKHLDDDRVLHILPDSTQFAAQETEMAWYAIAHTLAVWRRFCSWLIGNQIELHAVHLELARPQESSSLQRLFECPIQFGQAHNGIVFDARHLKSPLMHDEESLKKFLRNAPYHLLANNEVDSDDGIVAQMRRIIGQDLSHDFPSVVDMAEQLNMSVRTLRRRLKDVDTTYQEFKDEIRRDAATQFLSRPELRINAVAALLGFDEPSAFHRSFKKWTGSTPGDYRQSLHA
jgi:AraC-like DNA-binding protein